MADEVQEQKEFNEKVIAKIQEDPDFLGHLLEDAQGTLESAGLLQSPTDLSDQEREASDGEDVEGHGYITWYRTCYFWYRRVYYHRR